MLKQLNMQTGRYESVETPEETRRRTTKRPYYKTKAEWAGAEAASLRRQAAEMEKHPSGGSYSRAAKKAESIRNLLTRALNFERMQRTFKQRGV